MKNILITGSSGFIGTNLIDVIRNRYNNQYNILEFTSLTPISKLPELIRKADFVVHLSAVHRPEDINEYKRVNVKLTELIVNEILATKRECPIIFTSSIHVHGSSEFGKSKIEAENLIKNISSHFILRLTNLFGPFGRPNGHSVVATFMYDAVNDIPMVVNKGNKISLLYVGVVVEEIMNIVTRQFGSHLNLINLERGFEIIIDDLADKIISFKRSYANCEIPLLENDFDKNLYSTFLWYQNFYGKK